LLLRLLLGILSVAKALWWMILCIAPQKRDLAQKELRSNLDSATAVAVTGIREGARLPTVPEAQVAATATYQWQLKAGALAYVTDRSHVQYAGRLSLDAQLHLIRQGHGDSGANSDYVVATVEALERAGYRDANLHRLAAALRHEAPVHAGRARS